MSKIYSVSKIYLLLLTLLLLTSCATKFVTADIYQSQTRLDSYLTQANINSQAQSVSGSIRLTDPAQSVRLNYILWSNSDYPIRIDLMHSQAGIMAKIYEEQGLVLIYTPENNEVNKLYGSSEYLVFNQINLPFGLYQISKLMQNQMLEVFGLPKMEQVEAIGDIFRYQLERGTFDLNSQGQVISWHENKNKAWKLEIEYFENLPYNLKLEHPNGQKASIIIKSRQIHNDLYTQDKLELEYPSDASIKEIR